MDRDHRPDEGALLDPVRSRSAEGNDTMPDAARNPLIGSPLHPARALPAIPLTLMVRVTLEDTSPSMTWARPLLGDIEEATESRSASDAELDAARGAALRAVPTAPAGLIVRDRRCCR
ncbi:hypothetical protein GCM10023152_25540 [Agromyces bauzanensis]|uniref:Uncharacterized protein n=1 Tax=Agromyces bauzanensis TaxID=1308924 RepID=A0A917PN32_9MICO|nr:hypothetical protein GCM10011372_23510 [Agromyces bauzanensis]